MLRTIQIDALAAVDLRLAIERKMIGVFADENMGDHRLGRHPALDQMRRRRGLNNATLAGPAGIFGAPRDDDPDRPQVAKRQDIETAAGITSSRSETSSPIT